MAVLLLTRHNFTGSRLVSIFYALKLKCFLGELLNLNKNELTNSEEIHSS